MVKRLTRTGFTLTEAMLTVAIMGILSSLSAMLMVQINNYFIMTKARADLQKETRGAMYVIARELRQAQSATISIGRSSNGQPYYSQITFTKQQGQVMTIRQNGRQLQLVFGPSTTTLTKNLRYLAFTFPRSDDMTIVSISLTLETAIYHGLKKTLHTASEQVQVMD